MMRTKTMSGRPMRNMMIGVDVSGQHIRVTCLLTERKNPSDSFVCTLDNHAGGWRRNEDRRCKDSQAYVSSWLIENDDDQREGWKGAMDKLLDKVVDDDHVADPPDVPAPEERDCSGKVSLDHFRIDDWEYQNEERLLMCMKCLPIWGKSYRLTFHSCRLYGFIIRAAHVHEAIFALLELLHSTVPERTATAEKAPRSLLLSVTGCYRNKFLAEVEYVLNSRAAAFYRFAPHHLGYESRDYNVSVTRSVSDAMLSSPSSNEHCCLADCEHKAERHVPLRRSRSTTSLNRGQFAEPESAARCRWSRQATRGHPGTKPNRGLTLPALEGLHSATTMIGPFRIMLQQEVPCILRAIEYLQENAPYVFFNYKETGPRPINQVCEGGILPDDDDFEAKNVDLTNFYPYLLVNVKSGVSFHKVFSAQSSFRLGGSIIGGGTLSGLGNLLCHPGGNSAFDLFLMAQKGNNAAVDMLVFDIYGGDYPAIGLKGGVIASSFGRLQPKRKEMEKPRNAREESSGRHSHCWDSAQSLHNKSTAADQSPAQRRQSLEEPWTARPEESDVYGQRGDPKSVDFAKSILTMISYNTAQLAYYNATLYKCNHVVFVGNYLEMPGYLAGMQHCLDYWSNRNCRTTFVRLAPFLGALGAALKC